MFLHLANARQHAHQTAKTTHFLQLANLCQKIIHVELALGHPFGDTLGLIRLNGFGGLFNKRDNIAHVENAASHAGRVEILKSILLLANTNQLDRTSSYVTHGQRSTAACITIKTCQNDAGYTNRIVECLGGVDRILTGKRVRNEQNFMRFG